MCVFYSFIMNKKDLKLFIENKDSYDSPYLHINDLVQQT